MEYCLETFEILQVAYLEMSAEGSDVQRRIGPTGLKIPKGPILEKILAAEHENFHLHSMHA